MDLDLSPQLVEHYVSSGTKATKSVAGGNVRTGGSFEMVTRDLSRDLHDARAQAPAGDVVVRLHLFGIDHAEELAGVDLKALVAKAEIPASYGTEIRKGMRLAQYV